MLMSDNSPTVVCVVGSLRRQNTALSIPQVTTIDEAYKHIMSFGDQSFSNSWYMGMMALMGASSVGCNTSIVYADDVEKSRKYIQQATGVILATPVYFGMASSSIMRVLNSIVNVETSKAMGVISVGAKRNGGQETTNIFTLQLGLSKGFVLVGNGPPISQYGGTAVAGIPKAVLNDDYGLHSAFDTGRQIGIASHILNSKPDRSFNPRMLQIDDKMMKEVDPCKACISCPGKKNDNYKCIISDKMVDIFNRFIESDIFVVDCDHSDYVYRQFVERCRFLRRDDFRLAYKIFTTSLNSHIHQAHVIVNWIRQGAYILPYNPSTYLEFSQKIQSSKKMKLLPSTSYVPIGHER